MHIRLCSAVALYFTGIAPGGTRVKSMVIKLSRAGDGNLPAVEIIINLTLVKPQ